MITTAVVHATCRLHRSYGLTCMEWEELHALRDGCCHCCGGLTDGLKVDHDHAYGKTAVRGLVCHTCNVRLAYVDSGGRKATPIERAYLDAAWHLTSRRHLELVRKPVARESCCDCDAEPVGIAEVANMLGVTRQRVDQLRLGNFPEPWARLARGPIWRDTDIEAYAAATGRKVQPL